MQIENQTCAYLLVLLRCALTGAPAPAAPEGLDFDAFFDLARRQQVYNIVFPLLAALPAGFALVCGFTLWAVWLAAAGAALLCAVLIFAGRGHIRFARDPDRGAMWLCLLPVLAVTLYLLHTHVLHKVNGTLHTGQSCYGDMPMHLGFIEYIAQSGQFPPRYPLLAGAHRFGYPFLCETVSSVFLVPSAGGRAAGGVSAADGARLCQRIRHVLAVSAADAGQRGQGVSGVLSVFHG